MDTALELARKIETKLARSGTSRDAEDLVLELESIQRDLKGQASRESEMTTLLEEAQSRVEELEESLNGHQRKSKPLRVVNRC